MLKIVLLSGATPIKKNTPPKAFLSPTSSRILLVKINTRRTISILLMPKTKKANIINSAPSYASTMYQAVKMPLMCWLICFCAKSLMSPKTPPILNFTGKASPTIPILTLSIACKLFIKSAWGAIWIKILFTSVMTKLKTLFGRSSKNVTPLKIPLKIIFAS